MFALEFSTTVPNDPAAVDQIGLEFTLKASSNVFDKPDGFVTLTS